MHYLKDWILSQGIMMLLFLAFVVSAMLTVLLWNGLEKIENSKLGTPLRILLCLPIIFLGWCTISGVITFFCREYSGLANFAKNLITGPWISIVFFKAIPSRAKYVAIPFVLSLVTWEAYIAYLGFFPSDVQIFTTSDAVYALISIAASIGTYWFLLKQD